VCGRCCNTVSSTFISTSLPRYSSTHMNPHSDALRTFLGTGEVQRPVHVLDGGKAELPIHMGR
jgi:hypothetical protein